MGFSEEGKYPGKIFFHGAIVDNTWDEPDARLRDGDKPPPEPERIGCGGLRRKE